MPALHHTPKSTPLLGTHPLPRPSKSLLFPFCWSPVKGRRKWVQLMPLLARNNRAHSSRRGTFHHLCIFNLEMQISFFLKALGVLLVQHASTVLQNERELQLRLKLSACSSCSLPSLWFFFSIVVTRLALAADKWHCSNIFLMLHLIYCTLPSLLEMRQC